MIKSFKKEKEAPVDKFASINRRRPNQQETVKYPQPIPRDERGCGSITFKVVEGLTMDAPPTLSTDFATFIADSEFVKERKGTVVAVSQEGSTAARLTFKNCGSHNGFVAAALNAYNKHLHLILKPDDIWLAITTSLARHANARVESMRLIFNKEEDFTNETNEPISPRGGSDIDRRARLEQMSFGFGDSLPGNGKKRGVSLGAPKPRQLVTRTGGAIRKVSVAEPCPLETMQLKARGSLSNQEHLFDQLFRQVDENTSQEMVNWMTCNFSTTTRKEEVVSKLVLMGAMKTCFTYKETLLCGLPQVTLEGRVDDWKEIRARVEKMKGWSLELSKWSEVLVWVLNEFVRAAEGKPNTAFWNRIATVKGGGSGSRWLQGWILAFVAFDKEGRYLLTEPSIMRRLNYFGELDTNEIPEATVAVPVTVDDNGREHQVVYWAGFHTSRFSASEQTIRPDIDWAVIDVTSQN